MGRTAFLLADGTMRPRSGAPPYTMRLDMGTDRRWEAGDGRQEAAGSIRAWERLEKIPVKRSPAL
ncbi:hypothetical protein GCM10027019_24530 [Melaminivora jejuensis]